MLDIFAGGELYTDCWIKMCESSCNPLSIALVVLDSAILFTLPVGGWLYLRDSLSAASYLLFILLTMCFFTSFLNMVTIAMQSMELGSGLDNVKKIMDIDKLVNENVTSKKNKLLRSRFDKAATSKRWGKPIAIGMIDLGLICSMVIGFPLMGLFSGLISAISVPLANWLLDIGAAPFLVSLLCNAILTAVSFALQMASYVFGISLVFGLMEDVGYMARISYVFDG